MTTEKHQPGGGVPAEQPVEYETGKGCLIWFLILIVCAAVTIGLAMIAGQNQG